MKGFAREPAVIIHLNVNFVFVYKETVERGRIIHKK